MMEDLKTELEKIVGCLKHLRTDEISARRRFVYDEDLILPTDNPFIIDADQKLGPSKALRREISKTQVITSPVNLHVRCRRTHTDEVINVATRLASIFGLNVNLCRAIALGHDIGHSPFQHNGEVFLTKKSGKNFQHEIFGVVIAQKIERRGRGLNLTWQVLDGIRNTRLSFPVPDNTTVSLETEVVILADKIAYVVTDFTDLFLRFSCQSENAGQVCQIMESLGSTQRQRVNYLISEVCLESAQKGRISFSQSDAAKTFWQVKREMKKVYPLYNLFQSEDILERIYNFIAEKTQGVDPTIVVALMTDAEVIALTSKNVLTITDLMQTSVWEIIPFITGKNIDFTDPDLDW